MLGCGAANRRRETRKASDPMPTLWTLPERLLYRRRLGQARVGLAFRHREVQRWRETALSRWHLTPHWTRARAAHFTSRFALPLPRRVNSTVRCLASSYISLVNRDEEKKKE